LNDYSFISQNKPQAGALLISDPFNMADFFERTVVILCEHNRQGSFGFVLNKIVPVPLHEFKKEFPKTSSKLGLGGPVERQSLFFIHALGDAVENSMQISKDLYFGGNFKTVLELLKTPVNAAKVRFFLGYSGWSSGQLENELKMNSWIVVNNISSKTIMDTHRTDLWKHCLSKQGKQFKVMANSPLDPSNN
jgi:putative transcriptional regulator